MHATVFSGTHHVSYADLIDAIQTFTFDASPRGILETHSKFSDNLVKQIQDVWTGPSPVDGWFSDIEEWPPGYLLRCLAGMSLRNCSDPRDRVYAVRSLLGLQNAQSLIPDYRLDPIEVYQSLVLVLLETFRNRFQSWRDQAWALFALAGTDRTDPGPSTKPSWVPDFNALTSRSRDKIEQYTGAQWLEAPQFLPAAQLFNTQLSGSNELDVRATCFATVSEIFADTEYPIVAETDSERISETELSKFRQWYTRCQVLLRMPDYDEEVGAHSTTFLACASQLVELPREMDDEERATENLPDWWFPDRWPEDPNVVREHFMLRCAREHAPPDKFRRIARIDASGVEDYCWVPPATQSGDQVCVMAGATFPFVVRPLSQSSFALIGDAYLANTTLKQALGGGGKSRFDEDI